MSFLVPLWTRNHDALSPKANEDGPLRGASTRHESDQNAVLEAAKREGCALKFSSVALKDDRTILLEAAKQNWHALKHAMVQKRTSSKGSLEKSRVNCNTAVETAN
jgi:hypothetical protein